MKKYRKFVFIMFSILIAIVLCFLFMPQKSHATFQTSFEYDIKDVNQKLNHNDDISHFIKALKQFKEMNLTMAKTLYQSIDFTEFLKEGKPHILTGQNENILVYNNGKKIYIYSYTISPSVTHDVYYEPVIETKGSQNSTKSNMSEGSVQIIITGKNIKKSLLKIGMKFNKGDSIVVDWNKKNNMLVLSKNQTNLLDLQGLAVEMKTNESNAYLLKNTVKIPNEAEKNFKSKDTSNSDAKFFVLPTISITNDNYSLNEYTFDKGRKTGIYNSIPKVDAQDHIEVVSEFVFNDIQHSKTNVTYWIGYTY